MTYAGDVSPAAAFAALEADPDSLLVDVRTAAEWSYVGLPDLAELGKQVIRVEWQRFPDGSLNPDFLRELRGSGVAEGRPLFFLCRSGQRSRSAAEAATQDGLGPAYNIIDGFEGPLDHRGHRSVGGWKVAGLPWRQG